MAKIKTSQLVETELVEALDALGVHFLLGGTGASNPKPLPLSVLLTGLAESNDARLELALIPLLLHHPSLWHEVKQVAPSLPDEARLTLHYHYTAAQLL